MALSRNNSSSVSFRISFERIYICICCILIFFTYYLNINYTPLIYKILDKSPLINEGQLKQHKIKAIYSNLDILETNCYYLKEISFHYQCWSSLINFWFVSPPSVERISLNLPQVFSRYKYVSNL